MSNGSMFVFVGATLALGGGGAWWLWRRRRRDTPAAAAVVAPEYWDDERTLYATYEDLGIARPGIPAATSPEPTACIDMDMDMGLATSAATECLDMNMFDTVRRDEAGTSKPEPTAFLDIGEFVRAEPAPSKEPDPTACLDMSELGLQQAWAPPPPPPFAPKLELEPAPAPASTSSPARAARGVGPGELTSYFDDAVRAFEIWRMQMSKRRSLDAIADGPERDWIDAMALLKTGNAAARDQLLRPALHQPDSHRAVAALSLLERGELDLSATLAERPLDELFEALILWRGPGAEASLRRLALAQFPAHACNWARLLRARGFDPGAELLSRLLESDDPELVAAGLSSIWLHEGRDAHHGTVMSHMFEADPDLRAAAVEAGLRLRIDVAWIHCRQLATMSGRGRTCELVASLSTPAEQIKLIEWASRKSAPPHALWCAALTGRVAAIELALSQLDARGSLGRRCLTHLTGNDAADREWWRANTERFAAEQRWLAGSPHELGSVRAGLAELPVVHRSALALELEIRNPSVAPLPLGGFAHELRSALDQLGQIDMPKLEFERGYPWTPAPTKHEERHA